MSVIVGIRVESVRGDRPLSVIGQHKRARRRGGCNVTGLVAAGLISLFTLGAGAAAQADCLPWQMDCNGRAANGGSIDGYGNTWTQNPGGTYSDQNGRSWGQTVNGGWQRSDGYSVQQNMGGGYTDSTGESFTQALGGGWVGSRGTTCNQQISGVWKCGK
ncbi:MAG TPA: hypothetical protein VND94_15910 [Terriglobia bacterium]|nr:hypothetical protein [Terriglobia bacterium]